MSDFLQNVDFTSHSFNIGFVFDLVFFEDFYRNHLVSYSVGSYPYFPESPLTQRFTYKPIV